MLWLLLGIFIVYFIYDSNKKTKNAASRSSQTTRNQYKPNPNVKIVDISKIALSVEQKKIFEKLEDTETNIFVTGKAGTGKSLLLEYFKQNSKKRLVVVAPTGVAALNVSGQTINSLFRIPPGFVAKDSLKPVDYKTGMLLRNIDAVVIDEISMVRADLMDAIDHRIKQARSNNLPFGGVQIIMFGDLYQLPPVVDSELIKYFAHNLGGYYFFNAYVWQGKVLETYELKTIYRQKDESFKTILSSIREGKVENEMLLELNKRAYLDIPKEGVITLATTNATVGAINQERLDELVGKLFTYRATITGDLQKSEFPTEEFLKLKKGAQVMFLKNDRQKRWVNGTLAYIHSLADDEIKVNINSIVYTVALETWKKVKYYYDQESRTVKEDVISSFTQFPLRLAWAITVHKSQGQTYNSVAIDMENGAFAHGQTYVALSRCISLEGLYLRRALAKEDIIVDPDVRSFMEKITILDSNRI